jgi:hypothetical protein
VSIRAIDANNLHSQESPATQTAQNSSRDEERGQEPLNSSDEVKVLKYPSLTPLSAIIFCLKHFDYYISGSKFTLITDHKTLTFLFTQKKLSPHIINWFEVLLSFDFDVVYRPVVLNILPDRIIRLYDSGVDNQPRVICAIPAIESLEPDKEILDIWKRESLLEEQHKFRHFGSEKLCKNVVYRGVYWPTMRKEYGSPEEYTYNLIIQIILYNYILEF